MIIIIFLLRFLYCSCVRALSYFVFIHSASFRDCYKVTMTRPKKSLRIIDKSVSLVHVSATTAPEFQSALYGNRKYKNHSEVIITSPLSNPLPSAFNFIFPAFPLGCTIIRHLPRNVLCFGC